MILDTLQSARFTIAGFAPLDAVSVAETLAAQGHLSHTLPSVLQPFGLDEGYADALILQGDLATKICYEAQSTALKLDPLAAFVRPVIILGDFQRELTTSSFVHIVPSSECKPARIQIGDWIAELERHVSITSTAETVPTAKYRVLVVDDDPSMQSLVCHVLEQPLIDCYPAHDGCQALELAQVLMPDLIILDVHKPGLSGFDVLSQIRQNPGTRQASVLLLNVRNSADDVSIATKLGADMYVVKPIKVYEFRTRVETLLWKREKPRKWPPMLDQRLV